MPEVKTQEFRKASKEALTSQKLQASMVGIQHFHDAKAAAIEEITPQVWEELRQWGSEIKRHTIDNLDYYLEMLERSVIRVGGKVHFARDTDEANAIVARIAREGGVKVAVKSKSMVSEEMDLNHALEEMGVEPVETDLGEYIIQLAKETPFHIIAPAMHKSRQEVSQLFTDNLGTPPYDDIPELCRVAREALREKFLAADMGISGVNFAVAETGTIALVTNEGNGRMCTSLPRVHVAVMGMEKIVPRLEDLGVFLRLLPRAATGQRITSYYSFITGPRRPSDEDGPEELHLVILDNGRSRILADPDLRESLHCIRCGACLNACPIYLKVGGHAYGWVYPGPIGAVITPIFVGLSRANDLPFASTLCGACREACPVQINLPHMLLKLRSQVTEGGKLADRTRVAWWEKVLIRGWRITVQSPAIFEMAGKVGRAVLAPFALRDRVRGLPPPFNGWTSFRDFPRPAARPFRQRWREGLKGEEAKRNE